MHKKMHVFSQVQSESLNNLEGGCNSVRKTVIIHDTLRVVTQPSAIGAGVYKSVSISILITSTSGGMITT